MNVNKLKQRLVNSLKKTIKTYRTNKNVTIEEAIQIMATTKDAILIDVRSIQEYKEYHIDGAICIPHFEIQSRIEKEVTNKNALIIVYCQSGMRSKDAMEILEKKGYKNVYHIKNGLDG